MSGGEYGMRGLWMGGRGVSEVCGGESGVGRVWRGSVGTIRITFPPFSSVSLLIPHPSFHSSPSLLPPSFPSSSQAQTNSRVPGAHAVSSHHLLYFGPNIPNFFLRDDGTSPQTSNTPPLADKLGTYTGLPLSSENKKTSSS